jgi:mannose-1-phosphate guanylyltransferase
MRAFLLAAGQGTRLRPYTDTAPKCLLPIQNTPLLGIWLALCASAGIDQVLINTSAHRGAVKKYVGENSNGLSIEVTEEETLLGSAGTLLENRDWVSSEPEFWVFYADVLTNVNLTRMLEFHRQRKPLATIGVYEVSNPRECGIVTVDPTGMVTDFVEKPHDPSGNLAFAGLMIATPAVFDVIPKEGPADIGFHVLPKLVGHMASYPISEYLLDIGTPEKYQEAQKTWPGIGCQVPPGE